jgi:hypothetical protein
MGTRERQVCDCRGGLGRFQRRPASRDRDRFGLGPAGAFGSVGRLEQVQECGARDNSCSAELPQREQMALILGVNGTRLRNTACDGVHRFS